MAKVYFVREEISIEVPVGTSVLEAEIQAGLAPDVPCGGQGTCGKCLVKVDGKPVLACQTKVEKDCQVEIPGKKNRGKILREGFSRKVNFQPDVYKRQALKPCCSAAGSCLQASSACCFIWEQCEEKEETRQKRR